MSRGDARDAVLSRSRGRALQIIMSYGHFPLVRRHVDKLMASELCDLSVSNLFSPDSSVKEELHLAGWVYQRVDGRC